MREKLGILIMTLATFLMLSVSVIPHHHHEGMWCQTEEVCSVQDNHSLEHACHHGDHSVCLAETQFVSKASIQKAFKFIFGSSFITIPTSHEQVKCNSLSLVDEYEIAKSIRLYLVEITSGIGLRAPPSAIV